MESDNLQLDFDDLIRALNVISEHIRQSHPEPLEISEDYYWEIAETQLYDPTQDPSDFSLGQLSEDWHRVSQILSGEAPPIGYALVWLGSLLRVIGQRNIP